jgi:hypothetical protein
LLSNIHNTSNSLWNTLLYGRWCLPLCRLHGLVGSIGCKVSCIIEEVSTSSSVYNAEKYMVHTLMSVCVLQVKQAPRYLYCHYYSTIQHLTDIDIYEHDILLTP